MTTETPPDNQRPRFTPEQQIEVKRILTMAKTFCNLYLFKTPRALALPPDMDGEAVHRLRDSVVQAMGTAWLNGYYQRERDLRAAWHAAQAQVAQPVQAARPAPAPKPDPTPDPV